MFFTKNLTAYQQKSMILSKTSTKNTEKALFQPKRTHFIEKVLVFMHKKTDFCHKPDNISTKNTEKALFQPKKAHFIQ